jgi:oxalate decarboxylase
MISRRSALGTLAASAGAALAAGAEPAQQEQRQVSAPSYKFRLAKAKAHEFEGGSAREHYVADFPASHNISATIVNLKVDAFREPHWHPQADEWAYVQEGKVRLTIVGLHGQTTVEDFDHGDAWFVPVGFGHSVLNIGKGDAEILVVHNNGNPTTVDLSEWIIGGPKEVFAATLDVPEETLDKIPKKKVFLGRKRKK